MAIQQIGVAGHRRPVKLHIDKPELAQPVERIECLPGMIEPVKHSTFHLHQIPEQPRTILHIPVQKERMIFPSKGIGIRTVTRLNVGQRHRSRQYGDKKMVDEIGFKCPLTAVPRSVPNEKVKQNLLLILAAVG